MKAATAVGVIGLGIMGNAMARNLIKAGYRVSVFNRTQSKASAFADLGAAVCDSPRVLAEKSDVIIVMVTDPKAASSVLFGESGVFACRGHGKILIQMSTLDVTTTHSLAQEAKARGYEFLDSPVSGSKKQVEAAELIIEAGG